MSTLNPDNCEYLIDLPYPPEISPDELLVRKKNGPSLTKTANAFFVYRKAYVKELKRQGKRIKMTQISGVISYSWSRQSEQIRNAYKDIADSASEMFKKFNPAPEKQSVTKSSSVRGGVTANTAAVKSGTATCDANNPYNSTIAHNDTVLPQSTKKENFHKFSKNHLYQPYPLPSIPSTPYSSYSCYPPTTFDQNFLLNEEFTIAPFDYSPCETKENGTDAQPLYVYLNESLPPAVTTNTILDPVSNELSSGATTCSPSPSSSPVSSNATFLTPDTITLLPTVYNNSNNLQFFDMPTTLFTVNDAGQILAYPQDCYQGNMNEL